MSSSDEFDKIVTDSVKKRRRQKKLGIPKPIPILFDSPNLPKKPSTTPNTPAESDSDMDELEKFFTKMKTPSRSVPKVPVIPCLSEIYLHDTAFELFFLYLVIPLK